MIGNKAAMEEVRRNSIERDQVCIGKRSRLDGCVEKNKGLFNRIPLFLSSVKAKVKVKLHFLVV